MSLSAVAFDAIDDPAAFERLIAAGLIRVDDEQSATIVRPQLIEAFNEIPATASASTS